MLLARPLLLLLALLACGPAILLAGDGQTLEDTRAERDDPVAGQSAAGPVDDGILDYVVRFSGAPSPAAAELLAEVSEAMKATVTPPPSEALLLRRGKDDLPNLVLALRSLGYFLAGVEARVEAVTEPAVLEFAVAPGPRFTFQELAVEFPQGPPQPALPPLKEFGLETGQGFAAQAVLDAEKAMLRHLADAGYPLATVPDRRVVADFAREAVLVTFTVVPGPRARFGPVRVEGEDEVDDDFVRSRLPWGADEPFSQRRLDEARRELFDTGLFAQAEFVPDKELDADGRLPLTLRLTAREPRTVRAGATYATDLGPGVLLGWEHRNFAGGGERLSATLDANFVNQSLEALYREPQFLADRQVLRLTARVLNEEPEAFSSRSAETSAVLERSFGEKRPADAGTGNIVGGGVGIRFARIDDDPLRDDTTFGLVFLPLFASRDVRDNLLDPSSGYLLRADSAPTTNILARNVNYLRYTVDGAAYRQLLDKRRLILALRARFGQILGAELQEVPASERFFAGGGGSVRGYEFKTLSALEEDDDPVGGLSLVDASTELRFRFLGDYGITAFMDGGRAYTAKVPDPSERFFLGAGLGLRYHTGFGPIRLDVAFPLNRREDIDPRLQIYGSIGQAF